MRSLTSYLILIFAVLFWGFRLFAAAAMSIGQNIGVTPSNLTYEIILLFITLVALVLVFKRNLLGGILYFATYFLYFGTELYQVISNMTGEVAIEVAGNMGNVLASAVGIILAIAVLGDVVFNKNREAKRVGDKKTDWYYKNKAYDRQLDERADKNNYRTM